MKVKSLAVIRREVFVRNSFLRVLVVSLFFLPAIVFGQYFSITCDSQNPSEQFVLDKVFSGNTPMLRSYHYDDGVAIDLTPWAMEFYYSYGQYDTNGGVTIVGSVSSNCATYLGATNVFFQAYDRYYFSIKGTHSSGYTKTFATGRMIQDYDPGTDTNLITMMGQINMNWFSNNVGAQVESNRVRIAVFETSKVERVAFDGTNVIFEARVAANEAFDVAQALSNAIYEIRIASNETFRTTTQPATNTAIVAQIAVVSSNLVATNTALAAQINAVVTNQAVTNATLQTQITTNLAGQVITNLGYETRIAAIEGDYLTSITNIFADLYAANRSKLGTNLSSMTSATGSLTSVSYTSAVSVVIGRTYAYGFAFTNYGTGTLSIAGNSIVKTTAGSSSNYFAYHSGEGTNLVIKLDGTGSGIGNASGIYCREITNGSLSAYRVDVGAGGMTLYGAAMTNPAAHIAAVGTNAHELGTASTNTTSDFATSAQGSTADTALQPGDAGTWTNLSDYNNDIPGSSSNLSDYNNDAGFLTNEPIWEAASNKVVYTNTLIYTVTVANASAATNYIATNTLSAQITTNLAGQVLTNLYFEAAKTNFDQRINAVTSGAALGTTAWQPDDSVTNAVDETARANITATSNAIPTTAAQVGAASTNNFIPMSNAFAIVQTNYTPLPSFNSVSNAVAIITTNYAPLPSFIPVSNIVAGLNSQSSTWATVVLSMTNFVPNTASSTNYLLYNTTTRLLSGCVTNSGGGSGFPLEENGDLAGYLLSNGFFSGDGSGLTNVAGYVPTNDPSYLGIETNTVIIADGTGLTWRAEGGTNYPDVVFGTTASTIPRGDWHASVSGQVANLNTATNSLSTNKLDKAFTNTGIMTAVQITGGSPTNGAKFFATNSLGQGAWIYCPRGSAWATVGANHAASGYRTVPCAGGNSLVGTTVSSNGILLNKVGRWWVNGYLAVTVGMGANGTVVLYVNEDAVVYGVVIAGAVLSPPVSRIYNNTSATNVLTLRANFTSSWTNDIGTGWTELNVEYTGP